MIIKMEEEYDEIEVYKTLSLEESENKNSYPNLTIKIEKVQYSIFELNRRYKKDYSMVWH